MCVKKREKKEIEKLGSETYILERRNKKGRTELRIDNCGSNQARVLVERETEFVDRAHLCVCGHSYIIS